MSMPKPPHNMTL